MAILIVKIYYTQIKVQLSAQVKASYWARVFFSMYISLSFRMCYMHHWR